ncbi:FtsX-like permease family protein [Allokutzneria sp. NRRL B-24872]|uniref:FtsX-like permease family protein n=1 Tax=Allokutzneria sp. NRRL B-24872 TaxID=1137961 RepID=UPI000A379AEC|nr:FtsX-like permease family protein [Allokutzneria sp. NRRL B-24872]
MIVMAWRSLRARLPSAVASVVAVLLGSALSAAALIVGQSVEHASSTGALSTWDLRDVDFVVKLSDEVRTTSGLALRLPEQPRLKPAQLDKLRSVRGVRSVTGEIPFPAYVGAADAPHRSWGHPWSTALAEPFTLAEGHEPRADDEVVLNRLDGKRVGDTVMITTASGEQRFRVSGIGSWQGNEHALFFTASAAARMGGEPIMALLRVDPGTAVEGIREALPEAVVLQGEAKGRAFVLDPAQAGLAAGAGTFLGTISVLALTIAVFTIASTLSVSVMQRRRELALLRTVGASAGRVRLLVLGEAAFVGLAAGAVGGLVGVGLADLALRFFVAQGMLPSHVGVVLSAEPFLVGAGVAVVAAVTAGVLPAWRAARVSPGEAMRTADVQPAAPSRRRTVWGFVHLVFAVLCLVSGVVVGNVGGTVATRSAPVLMFLAAPSLVMAAVLFGHKIVGGVLAVLFPLRDKVFAAYYGDREIRGDLKRSVGVATPLMLMVAFACLILFQDSATSEAKSRAYDQRLTADVVVTGAEHLGLPASVVEQVRRTPGVHAASATVSTGLLPLDGDAPRTVVDALGVDPAAIPLMFDLPARSGDWKDFNGDSIAVSQTIAQDYQWQAGQRVSFLLPDGTSHSARVAVVYESGSVTFASMMVPRDVVRPHLLEPFDSGIYVRTDVPGALAGLNALSRNDHLADVARQSSGDNWILYAVVAVIAGYAGIAAITVLTGSAASRRRGFVLLRLAGARTAHVVGAVGFEVAVTVVTGVLTGSAVAGVVLTGYGYALTGDLWLPFPVAPYLLVCGAAVVVGALGGLLPARIAARTSARDQPWR